MISIDFSQEMSNLSPKAGSLSSIIRSYKAAVTHWCKQNGYDNFAWQPRFYEHIIRADDSLNKIREYIVNNPLNGRIIKIVLLICGCNWSSRNLEYD